MPRHARALPPERVREIGIALNDGRIPGWLERASELLATPLPTIGHWSAPIGTPSSRAIPGAPARLLLLYAILQQRGMAPDSVSALIERRIADG
jgi:hypothetical protein